MAGAVQGCKGDWALPEDAGPGLPLAQVRGIPYRNPYIKGPQNAICYLCFHYFFVRFSIYLAASAAKYREKGRAVTKTGEG